MKKLKRLKKSELEKKVWFRIIKVIYIFGYIYFLLMAIGISYTAYSDTVTKVNWFNAIVCMLLGALFMNVLLKLVKRLFYYIVLGERFYWYQII